MRTEKKLENNGAKKGISIRKFQIAAFALYCITSMKAYANAGYAQNALKTVTSEAQGIGWVVLAVILIPLLARRNWVAVVITAIFGAATVVLISQPELLKTIGTYFVTGIFG